MSADFLTTTLLWAQANIAKGAAPAAGNAPPVAISREWIATLKWLYLSGDPTFTTTDILGGVLTWIKALSLLCLLGWIVSWLVIGFKERLIGQGRWYDYLGLAGVILTPVAVMLRVLESVHRIPVYRIGAVHVTAIAAILCAVLYVAWVEASLGRTIRRLGKPLDMAVVFLVHVALLFGLAVGLFLQQRGFLNLLLPTLQGNMVLTWRDGLVYGARMSLTYMGYIVFLRILALCLVETLGVRGRRLYSIAQLSIYESTRRMWAPWVVITVFLLVLAFTHWFLQPPRPAEMGRLYVSTLILLCSVLLTVMVTILTPLSLPTDIQQQTIYTVVSKPVRRLELIWGRMIGYMALVTALMVLFGAISLYYLSRTVGSTIKQTDAARLAARKEGRITDYKLLTEQADQLRARMSARVPVKGSLSFIDSAGKHHPLGIDVGMDVNMKEPRSHIEGATSSRAIWSFGVVPSPFSPPGRPIALDRRIPVEEFLRRGTWEWALNHVYEMQEQLETARAAKSQPNVPASKIKELDAAIARNQAELERARSAYEAIRSQPNPPSSDPIAVEMSFNVYRTTKGKVGEPVYAEMQVINPRTRRDYEADVFPIKEYYTNKVYLPAWVLAGSGGALRIEIGCLSPTQYLGMAESDLYLLLPPGRFGVNYMKGLFGVWLQAMVLTAIGVCVGTFLSWPVALLTTIAFFIAGQMAFAFLVDFTRQAIVGGGPFESLIRLLTHDNQMSELTPTSAVVLAKTLDAMVMPLMSMLVYVVPNFQAMDVSNTVSDGFAVTWRTILGNSLLALGYALPFSFVAYLVLKNREVAA
jgi:ABC-type transport system involved in multi-copper enzyme maturation permease subunit